MPQDTPSRKLDQYIVRFPDGMRDRIRAAAKANNRSMNAEITYLLEWALDYFDVVGREAPITDETARKHWESHPVHAEMITDEDLIRKLLGDVDSLRTTLIKAIKVSPEKD